MSETKVRHRYVLLKENSLIEGIVKIVLAFLLTTVLGTLISAKFQERQGKRELEHRLFQQKKEFFEEVCEDIDARYYAAYRCMTAYKVGDPWDKQADLYEEYQLAVARWNTHRMKNAGLIEVYFSDSLAESFQQVHLAFGDQLHDTLRTMSKNPVLDPGFDVESATPEEKERHATAHRVLRNYFPDAFERLEQAYQEFASKASSELSQPD